MFFCGQVPSRCPPAHKLAMLRGKLKPISDLAADTLADHVDMLP
jgi:hypothetical protein